jgi:hypothetical protein
MFKAPSDALMLAALWRPLDREQGKPHPTTDVFARSWWSLRGMMHLLKAPDSLVMEVTKESAYGRWIIGIEKDTRKEYLQFRGHKRVKAWWERLYRQQFKFPLEIGDDAKTELDYHMAWEHYDIHLQKSDKSSIMFLGFMCPWCGVWLSSTRVQEMKNRCEFCCVINRTTPAQGESDA